MASPFRTVSSSTEQAERIEMRRARTRSALSLVLLMLVACVAASFAAVNARAWSESLKSGRIEGTYSLPLYGPMVVPDGQGSGASGRLGADHASLFFTARDYLAHSKMYDPAVDPWGRTAETFPPYLVFLIAHSTARLDFVSSALLNNFVQVFLFGMVSAYFVRNGPSSWAVRTAGIAVAAFAVFCTPVGVTWFERAQTDLFCASAMLLLLKGMRDDTWFDFVLAGLVASAKWSSLPFFAMAAIPYVLLASEQWTRKIVLIGLSVSLPFLLLGFFGEDAKRYLSLVYLSERGYFDGAVGVSMALYFPRLVAKVIPFALPLLFVLVGRRSRRSREPFTAELIFWASAAVVSASFGTTAYEYRFLTSIIILPLVIDGRSIVFSSEKAVFSNVSRIIGIVFLAYALRLETIPFVNTLISKYRAIVPMFVGVSLLLWSSLLAFGYARHTNTDC